MEVKRGHKQSNKGKQEQFNLSEIYRQLRTNLEYTSFEKSLQVVNFTSTYPAEGKSSVASNLAMVSVVKYRSVLLMDCDLRRPVQHKMFQITNKIGLSDVIKNMQTFNVEEDTYFQKFKDTTSDGKLYVLTAGTKVPNPQEMLASNTFKELLEKLKTRFDLILIDCPPVRAVADAIPVSNVADGTVFVVSAKETNKHDAKAALTQLERNGAHILGSVLTKVESESARYYGYYSNE